MSSNACADALRETRPLPPLDLRSFGRGIMDRPRFREAVAAHAGGKPVPKISCAVCRDTVDLARFVNAADAKEFMLSGMCLPCQDNVFRA